MHDLFSLLKEYKSYLWRISVGMVGLMLFILAINYGEEYFSPAPRLMEQPRAQQLQSVKRWLRCRCLTTHAPQGDTLVEEYLLGYDGAGRLRAHNQHIFFHYDSLNHLQSIDIYHDNQGYSGRRLHFRYLSLPPATPFSLVEATLLKIRDKQILSTSYFVALPCPPQQAAWYEYLPSEEPLTDLPKKQKEEIWLMQKGEKQLYWLFDDYARLTEEIELDPYLPTAYALLRRRFAYDAKGLLSEIIQTDSIINPGRNIFRQTGKHLYRYEYETPERPVLYEQLLWNGVEWKLEVRRKCRYEPVERQTVPPED
ncbi:hypothetical protein FHS56_000457 [Thermonema lapsum]|uniref:Uncharacterized protein n=1 Tax=Thermonema lapsum TaxID=28195 RepID=A0A846MND9_9BACT|nr:hypothetical protein [Thermonema lapsum]NIK72971.1 hypothetical protein [Thermonema lapsum]